MQSDGSCRRIFALNIRKLVKFLFNTFIIGGVSGLLISFFVQWDTYAEHLNPINWMELVGLVLFFGGLGFTFSVISMTGYFAYLYIHRFGISLFRSFWPAVQVVLIVFVLFDLIYFPYRGSDGEIGIYWLILGNALFFLYAWFFARIKRKETNKSAFLPTIFFLIVMTTLEWTPALIAQGMDYVWLALAPLLLCNTYLIIGSHRIANRVDGKSKKDPARENKQNAKKPTRQAAPTKS
jgi:KinB signaling pathway activation protein